MKLLGIFRFEIGYQLRRTWPWLIFTVLIVFAFFGTRDGGLAEALYDEFFLNSPFAIAKAMVTGSLIWLLISAAIAGEAAARDVSTGMHPLIYTAPVSKSEYLGGRLLAAFVLNALVLLAIPAGILLAVYLPGIDPVLIGPFRPAAYLTAYVYLALPNAFAATAVQFLLAARSGRPMASYGGSLLLFFMSYVVGLFLLTQGRQDLARLLDAIGVHFILSDLSYLWTSYEKSWRLIELEGTVLTNRLLWVGVAVGAVGWTYRSFRFEHRDEGGGRRRWRKPREAHVPFAGVPPIPSRSGVAANPPISVPQVPRTFGFASHTRRTLLIARQSCRAIVTSWAGIGMLVAIPLMTVMVVLDQMEVNGVRLIPRTMLVLSELTAPLSSELSRWVIVPLLIVFFAGELVWRERDAGMAEISDAMPGSEWSPLLGKFLGLGLVLILFMAFIATAGMVGQRILGHPDFQVGLYLTVLFGLQLPEYLLFAILAVVVHVLVDQKYVGHVAAILAYVFILLSSMFGVEHNLLVYGAGPWWSYSEMSGFGPHLGPWLWFKLYWAAWALLLAVVAKLLWVRGRDARLRARLRMARFRVGRTTALAAGVAAALVLTLGGFVFYNTNVLNEYLTAAEGAARSADYERRYGRFADVAQPRLTATTLNVEIHPERREAEIRGTYDLVNRSAVAIDSIHVAVSPHLLSGDIELSRPAALVLSDERHGHRIYDLAAPLQPGDSLRLDFEVRFAPRGFSESGPDPSVVANGTYFTDAWLPRIGYQRSRELTNPADRREHGLAERPLIPSLYDTRARMLGTEPIAFEAVVGTAEDQVAVAPGRLVRSWTEGGRRYFHYSTEGPVGNDLGYAFLSADYAVREARWNDVTIQIFHDPGHTAHLERTIKSVRASLDYYTKHFGPYPRSYLSVVEHPGSGTGMHADAGMISHAEGFVYWSPGDTRESLDLPYAVVAHETAHQWTLPYAFVEGAPVMSESLAWYYGIQVVRENLGPEQLRRLLTFMRQPSPYPPIRRGEPLLRGLDPYMSYRRGPFALHALSEYVGGDSVNTALRRLVEKHSSGAPPLATTLDLYRELQAVTPDSLRYLLHDLFEVNTFWELETVGATAEPTGEDAWLVTLDVRARKVVADSTGVETEVPMDEWVQIGIFAASADGAGELSAPLHLRMHRIRSGEQRITVTVRDRPDLAGIDPHHLLDWVEKADDDNIDGVQIDG